MCAIRLAAGCHASTIAASVCLADYATPAVRRRLASPLFAPIASALHATASFPDHPALNDRYAASSFVRCASTQAAGAAIQALAPIAIRQANGGSSTRQRPVKTAPRSVLWHCVTPANHIGTGPRSRLRCWISCTMRLNSGSAGSP